MEVNFTVRARQEVQLVQAQRRKASLSDFKDVLTEARDKIRSGIATKNASVKLTPIYVSIKLDKPITTSIVEKMGVQWIQIKNDSKTIKVPRSRNRLGVGAQTGNRWSPSGEEFDQPILIVELFPQWPENKQNNHRFTYRGVCWIHPGKNAEVDFEIYNWHDPGITENQLVNLVELAHRRAQQVISGTPWSSKKEHA